MIRVEPKEKIILITGITDFRLGINGLKNKVYSIYTNDVNNTLFVFCSKNRKQIKILEFDDSGIWLYQKKLNKYKFTYPESDGNITVNHEEFISLFNVINILTKDKKNGT